MATGTEGDQVSIGGLATGRHGLTVMQLKIGDVGAARSRASLERPWECKVRDCQRAFCSGVNLNSTCWISLAEPTRESPEGASG